MKTPEQLKGAIRNLAKEKEYMRRKFYKFSCLNVLLNAFPFLRIRTALF